MLRAAIPALLALLAGSASGIEPPWPRADALAADLQDMQASGLQPAQMERLEALLAQYRNPSGIRLDPAALDGILAETTRPLPEPEFWLGRLWDWLVDRLRDWGLELNLDWLKLGQYVPSSVFGWAFGLSMTAIIVLALVLAVNEIRHSQWQRWQRERLPAASAAARPEATQMSWEQAASLPPGERPRAALGIVLAALSLGGLLQARAGDTHRALAEGAGRLGPKLRSRLRRLAALAERVRYGGWRPKEQDGDQALALGRAIVGQPKP